jgi:hypothetical protein
MKRSIPVVIALETEPEILALHLAIWESPPKKGKPRELRVSCWPRSL